VLSGCTIAHGVEAVSIFSQNATVTQCIVQNSSCGIYLKNARHSTIIDTFITRTYCGIYFYNSTTSTLYRNIICDNDYFGVYLEHFSDDNKLFHNSFVNTSWNHAYDLCSNIWDDGYPSGGNYWGGFSHSDRYCGPNQSELGADGIIDTYYAINGADNYDQYPLVTPTCWQNTPPVVPCVPEGIRFGAVGARYYYTTISSDHEGYDLFYNFSWGDDSFSGWLGPFPSGTEINASHVWDIPGRFHVKVKVKDTRQSESIWSHPLSIRIMKYQIAPSILSP
jgi:parallel beta-helix repeat protein